MSASSTVTVLREELFAIFGSADFQLEFNSVLLLVCATVLF